MNEPENPVLELLRGVRAKQDRQDEKLDEIIFQLSSVERLIGSIYADKTHFPQIADVICGNFRAAVSRGRRAAERPAIQ